jgi:hypothetical protein
MKAFSIFCIEVVRRAVELNVHEVVTEGVKFRNLKVVAYAQIDEDVFVIMESAQSVVKKLEGISCVHWILCQIKKVQ